MIDQMSIDEDITIGCAFRYALGRRTYVVDSVAKTIEANALRISEKTRDRIIQEIGEAIKEDRAGMTMDVVRWQTCRTILEKSLELPQS